MTAIQYSMLLPNFWSSELRHGAAFLTNSAQLTKPETKCMRETNLKLQPIALCVCVCVCFKL